ncbi:hypothetical protein ACFX14_005371 [Malus domestica]|nr:uncharacterized protein LOC103446722 isoform X1 [Malus domestica]
MARNDGVMIRQTLFRIGNGIGNGSYGPSSFQVLHGLHSFPNCIKTLKALTLIPTTPSLSLSIHATSTPKSPVLLDSPHFLQHQRRLSSAPAPSKSPSPSRAPAIKFPSPADIVVLWKEDEVERAIQKVKDGQLAAVFYFAMPTSYNSNHFGSPTVRKMREQIPHVTVYKYVFTSKGYSPDMNITTTPTFRFYQNGEMVDEIFANPYQNRRADEIPKLVIETCEKLYRHVIRVESTQPMSSPGKGKGKRKRRTHQQLVVQAKTDKNENDKVVSLGVGKVGDALLSQRRGAATSSELSDRPIEAADSISSAPSLDEAVEAVASTYPGPLYKGCLRWYAKGVFKANPEKIAMFLKVARGDKVARYDKVAWLLRDVAED